MRRYPQFFPTNIEVRKPDELTMPAGALESRTYPAAVLPLEINHSWCCFPRSHETREPWNDRVS